MDYRCIGFFVLVLIALIVLIGSILVRNMQEKKELGDALQAYQTILEQLKTDPTNADLRQRTLQLGRVYSNLTRNKTGVTIYDEVAVMNDINAACGGTVNVQGRSVEERLARLQQLLAGGHIAEDEYRRRRQSIIDEV